MPQPGGLRACFCAMRGTLLHLLLSLGLCGTHSAKAPRVEASAGGFLGMCTAATFMRSTPSCCRSSPGEVTTATSRRPLPARRALSLRPGRRTIKWEQLLPGKELKRGKMDLPCLTTASGRGAGALTTIRTARRKPRRPAWSAGRGCGGETCRRPPHPVSSPGRRGTGIGAEMVDRPFQMGIVSTPFTLAPALNFLFS